MYHRFNRLKTVQNLEQEEREMTENNKEYGVQEGQESEQVPESFRDITEQEILDALEQFKAYLAEAPEGTNQWKWAKNRTYSDFPRVQALSAWRFNRRVGGISSSGSQYDDLADMFAAELSNYGREWRRSRVEAGLEEEREKADHTSARKEFASWIEENDIVSPDMAAHFAGCSPRTIYGYKQELEDEGYEFESHKLHGRTFWLVTERPADEDDQEELRGEIEELTEMYLKMQVAQEQMGQRIQEAISKLKK